MNITNLIEKKVFSYIEDHHMLQQGDHVVAGVSGGADSVCLLFLLLEYAKKVPISITVVHINHLIRPDAQQDADYVKELCDQRNIPFYLKQADIKAIVKETRASEEEAGRQVRYQAFFQVAQEVNANKIAVAHNSNDCSETMLFHLFRGSGMKGLSGILPTRDNIIRPILCLERGEIEEYLQKKGIGYCQDSTNASDDYTRNRIRHHIIPYAEQEIVSGSVQHMVQTATLLSQVEDYLVKQTGEAKKDCFAEKDGRINISCDAFSYYHSVIQDRLLFSAIVELSTEQRDIQAQHVKNLKTLFYSESGKRISLPYGILARREYDKVVLEKEDGETKDQLPCICVSLKELSKEPLEITLDQETSFIFQLFSYEKNKEVPQNQYTKWFDYDKIVKSLEIRGRRQGDFLSIKIGEDKISHKSLKDYMITEKIPRPQRERTWLLVEEHHVLWLTGYRISEEYKINENTKTIMQVQLIHSEKTEDENVRAY